MQLCVDVCLLVNGLGEVSVTAYVRRFGRTNQLIAGLAGIHKQREQSIDDAAGARATCVQLVLHFLHFMIPALLPLNRWNRSQISRVNRETGPVGRSNEK